MQQPSQLSCGCMQHPPWPPFPYLKMSSGMLTKDKKPTHNIIFTVYVHSVICTLGSWLLCPSLCTEWDSTTVIWRLSLCKVRFYSSDLKTVCAKWDSLPVLCALSDSLPVICALRAFPSSPALKCFMEITLERWSRCVSPNQASSFQRFRSISHSWWLVYLFMCFIIK